MQNSYKTAVSKMQFVNKLYISRQGGIGSGIVKLSMGVEETSLACRPTRYALSDNKFQ